MYQTMARTGGRIMALIYIVEDDKNISDLIHMYLVKEGFDVRMNSRATVRPI